MRAASADARCGLGRRSTGEKLKASEEARSQLSPNGSKRRLLQASGHTSRSDPESAAMPDRPAGHEPELLTIVEAAELLRAPVATLRYWRHLGTGSRSFRLGRRVLYRSVELGAWVDARHSQDRAGRS